MMLREKMETLIFALIASYNVHRTGKPCGRSTGSISALLSPSAAETPQTYNRGAGRESTEAYVPQTALTFSTMELKS